MLRHKRWLKAPRARRCIAKQALQARDAPSQAECTVQRTCAALVSVLASNGGTPGAAWCMVADCLQISFARGVCSCTRQNVCVIGNGVSLGKDDSRRLWWYCKQSATLAEERSCAQSMCELMQAGTFPRQRRNRVRDCSHRPEEGLSISKPDDCAWHSQQQLIHGDADQSNCLHASKFVQDCKGRAIRRWCVCPVMQRPYVAAGMKPLAGRERCDHQSLKVSPAVLPEATK